MSHHPDCPALYFVDHPERCRCVFMAVLDAPARHIVSSPPRCPACGTYLRDSNHTCGGGPVPTIDAPPCVISDLSGRPICLTHDVLASDWTTADDGPTATADTPTCPLAGEPTHEPDEERRPWTRAREDEASR